LLGLSSRKTIEVLDTFLIYNNPLIQQSNNQWDGSDSKAGFARNPKE
jgi:hypothetical protein